MPAIHQRHHDSVLCGNGQILKILAVLAAGGIVSVAVVVGHAGLNTVHMMRGAVAVNHQVLISGNTAAVIRNIKASVIVIEESVACFAVVVVSAQSRDTYLRRWRYTSCLPRQTMRMRSWKHRNDHENGKECRKQSHALGFENSIHLDIHPFILIKKKALRFSAEDFVPYLVVVMRIRRRWRMIRRLVIRSRC